MKEGTKMQMRSLMAVAVLTCGWSLAGCGGEPAVTDAEAANFTKQVHAQVPYMKQYTNKSDLKGLAKSVCDSLSAGQSYGNVSETVGAYIRLPASSGEVDDVIKVAVKTSCPEENTKG